MGLLACKPSPDLTTDLFVLIADTSQHYDELRIRMLDLAAKTSWPIDSLGRSYNKAEDQIFLPSDWPDRAYAGQYFMRAFSGDALSLEYYAYYKDTLDVKDRTIALVACISRDQIHARERLERLQLYYPDAFLVKVEVSLADVYHPQ